MKDWKQKQPLYVNGILEVVMLGSFDAGTEGATKAERDAGRLEAERLDDVDGRPETVRPDHLTLRP